MEPKPRFNIVADSAIPFLEGVFEPYADVKYIPGEDICAADVKDADALIIRTRTKCNAELLDGSAVKFIATATIGTDHIDFPYCDAHGITVRNAPGCNAGGSDGVCFLCIVRTGFAQGDQLGGRHYRNCRSGTCGFIDREDGTGFGLQDSQMRPSTC